MSGDGYTIVTAVYGLASYSFGYWWRARRDRRIARDLERQLAELRAYIRGATDA